MQTLMARLTAYCEKNEKPMPYGSHLRKIGGMVAMAVKESGLYENVRKTTEEMTVNAYPDEAIEVIDDVIMRYFFNSNVFVRQATKATKKKYFNYDVEDYKAPAFEEALKKCGFEVSQNKCSNGKAQYRVESQSPPALVKLGKVFQKERWLQENRQRVQKRQMIKS